MSDRQAICYGYGRHSTNKQELTREVQEFRTYDHWERNLKDKGIVWGGFFYDPATSARIPFSERQHGRILHAVAQPGDHILVTKLDRPFRSLRDGIVSMEQWSDRGVIFHSLDLQVDTSTPLGKFFRTILLAVAELEREFTRERTRETVELRKRAGQPYSTGCPVGWRIVGEAPHRRYRTDEDERALVDEMARLRDDGASYDDLALWSMKQQSLPCKRTFPTRGQTKWAINARRAGYPKIANYKVFNRMVSRGEIKVR
jgi:DNA invertase Pin-like site-specific DNA recombinase